MTSDEFTAGSYNFVTTVDGSITKRPTDVLYNPTPLAAVGKDQFEAIFSSGVHHLLSMVSGTLKYSTGDGVVTTAKTGYTANANMEYSMYQNRVYFDNGVDAAAVYDLTTAYGGVSYTFPTDTIKAMGCQAPGSAITFNADTNSGGAVPVGGHIYKATFLYYGFEESNGGTASALHTVSAPNQTINLKTIPTGGYGVTARNIYRDNNDGNFVLVGTLSDNTTTTFTDTASIGTTAMPTSNNVPPTFSYIALNLSRFWVAGVSGTPTTIYWSLPGLPDIFDPDNAILCNPKDPIQGIFVYQGTTYVFNRHSFGRILGTTDDTFYYDEFPGSVGCVDNRSLQVRTINGVPVLIWLSDRGFYAFNGSSAEYISDPIEDLVNLNIQQVSFVTGSNSQSTLADFQAGTATAGIDLLTNPGTITTHATTDSFQSEADWESGSSLVNIATADGSNQLKVPVMFAPTLVSGTLAGDISIVGGNLQLSTTTDWMGESFPGAFGPNTTQHVYAMAFPIVLPRNGTITSFDLCIDTAFGSSGTLNVKIWNDSLGQPGSVLYSTTWASSIPGTNHATPSLTVSAGTYWIGFESTSSATSFSVPYISGFSGGNMKVKVTGASIWSVPTSDGGSGHINHPTGYAFSITPISTSGTWISAVYDSFSVGSAVSNLVANTGSFPTSCSGTLFVDESNDSAMSTGVSTFSQANPNGSYSPSLTNKRYWRLRYSLASTNNLRTPSVTAPSLTFNTTGTWISPVIDCTADVVSYNAITLTDDVPAGTSVTVTVATSADNITYSSFVAVGSAVVNRYVKVKIVMTTTTDNMNTPGVSLLTFSWNLSSTFTSSIINVGQAPSGWGLFQDVAAAGAGTVTFYMRSATTSGGIPGATFHAVTNGTFPDVLIVPNQYTQWKAVLTTAPGTLPTIDSVTVNWFLGNNQSPIRAASLFFDRSYYCAAAELNQTTNNIVVVYDQEGNWRLFRGLTVNSMGLFFNQPFYLDSVRPNIYQFLVAPNGTGTAITMDVRTKAFDLTDITHLKSVRALHVSGINTGTTIHAYYSVDRGVTWIEMLNSNGATGYVTNATGSKFNEYFVPTYVPNSVVSGVTVMFRVTSTDAFPCSILSVKPDIMVRHGKYLGRPL